MNDTTNDGLNDGLNDGVDNGVSDRGGTARVRVVVGGEIGSLRDTLDAADGVDVVSEVDDLEGVLAAVEARMCDVAVISGGHTDLHRAAVSQLRASGLAVVGAVPPGDTEVSRDLRRLGVHARLFTDSGATAVSRVMQDVTHQVKSRHGTIAPVGTSVGGGRGDAGRGETSELSGVVWRRGTDTALPSFYGVARRRVIAVWGPAGAPGRSTVAIGLAGAFARRGIETVLIDADTYGGSVAPALSLLDESSGLLAVARAADRGALSVPGLAERTVEVEPRLRVLTGLPTHERWAQIRPASLEAVLGLARDLARVTVVDCGFSLEDDPELSYDTYAPRRNSATLTALAAADDVLVVGRDDPVGLARLEAGLIELRAIGGSPTDVVLNQVRTPAPEPDTVEPVRNARSSAPVDHAASRRAAAWRRLRDEYRIHQVPSDPDTVDKALIAGVPVTSVDPGSPVALAIDIMARSVVPRRGYV